MNKTILETIDHMVLYTMNRRLPATFEGSYKDVPSLEEVLAATAVNETKTAVSQMVAPGVHSVWLDSRMGPIKCHVRVRPAVDPHAPVLIYHHGFSEFPYYASWTRIFPSTMRFPFHVVCVQAPFHDEWRSPFDKGMASVESVYQMFSGSLRIMQMLQTQFEAHGAAYTILAGCSWGGITSLLYQGLFHSARVVIPMLSAPNLAQVMRDIAKRFKREIEVPEEVMEGLLDFTPYFARCERHKVFPLLGESDMFFRLENHASVYGYEQRPLTTIPQSHITGLWQGQYLRAHILKTLAEIS